MKLFCKYHPTRPAHWYCPDCDSHFCPDCIETKRIGALKTSSKRQCAKCGSDVQWVGVGNLIEPFWQRIPKLFLYALSPWPLALNLLLCGGIYLFSGPGLFSGLMRLLFYAMLLKYSFSALRATAKGTLVAPPISHETVSSELGQVFKQFVLYGVLVVAAVYLAARVGPVAGGIFSFAALLYVPAMIIMLAASNSLFAALNPMLFGPLAFRIGTGYLIMYFFLTILAGAPTALWLSVLQHLPESLRSFLSLFAFNFYTIITYHLMGYVILQYHDEIGYEVEYDDFREAGDTDKDREASPEQHLLSRVNILIKEGALDEALELIRVKFRYEPLTDPELTERYFDLVQLKNRADILRDRGAEMLRLLIDAKRKQKAGEVYVALSAADPSFAPDSGDLFKIAGWLNETGKYRESLGAYNRFVKSNPEHESLPMAYFAAARLFNERLGKPEKARETLLWMQKKYPHHELMPHVRSYMARISS